MDPVIQSRFNLPHVPGLLRAHVLDVQPVIRTMTIMDENGRKYPNVLYSGLQYMNVGVETVPVPGWSLYVTVDTYGKPFPISWGKPEADPLTAYDKPEDHQEGVVDARHKYDNLRIPGDYQMRQLGGSFLEMLRGGITNIGASDICQIMMHGGIHNILRVLTQQLQIVSDMGINTIYNNDGKTTQQILYTKSAAQHMHSMDKVLDKSSGEQYQDISEHYEMKLEIGENASFITLSLGYLPQAEGDKKPRPERVEKFILRLTENGGLNIVAGQDLSQGLRSWEFSIFGDRYNKEKECFESNSHDQDHEQGDWEFCVYASDGVTPVYSKSLNLEVCRESAEILEEIHGNYTLNIKDGDFTLQAGNKDEGYTGSVKINAADSITTQTDTHTENARLHETKSDDIIHMGRGPMGEGA